MQRLVTRIRHIMLGWGKAIGWISTTWHERRISEIRLKICSSCPESKTSRALKIANGTARHEDVIYCKICKCPCLQKTLVTAERCPLKKW